MEGDRGINTLLIIVGVVLVFVEREVPVGSGIDAEFEGVGGFLRSVLQIGTMGRMEPART